MPLNKAQLMEVPGGPGITGAVKSGTGITISGDGTISVNPATNVTQLIAGTNITLNPANGFGAVTITAGGGGGGTITGVTAGSGLSGGGTSGTVTLSNSGVTSLNAGSGIGLSGNTGAITITNTGGGGSGTITGVTAGTGLSGGGTSGSVTLSNSGVTRLSAGSNVTLTGNTGDITISAGGGGGGTITGVTAGTGLSGGGTSGNVTLSNSGVTGLSAGPNITLSGGTGQITISASSGAVQQLLAGRGISLSPANGLGTVTVSDTGAITAYANFSRGAGNSGGDTPIAPGYGIRNQIDVPAGFNQLLVYSSVAFCWLYDTAAGNTTAYNMIFANGLSGDPGLARSYQAAQASPVTNIGNIQIPTVCFCTIQLDPSVPTSIYQLINKTQGFGPLIPNDSSLMVLAYKL